MGDTLTEKDWSEDFIKDVEKFTGKKYEKVSQRDLQRFLKSRKGEKYRHLFE